MTGNMAIFFWPNIKYKNEHFAGGNTLQACIDCNQSENKSFFHRDTPTVFKQ